MKVYNVYGKYFLKRDTMLATVFMFIVIGLLSLIPINTAVLDPLKNALSDFEFNDLAYAKLGKNSNTRLDNRQVIVNVGWLDRSAIAHLLQIVRQAAPSTIGLDVQFNEAKDPTADTLLHQTLQTTPGLVMAARLYWRNNKPYQDSGFFSGFNKQFGYVNFVAKDRNTIRHFSALEKRDTAVYHSFAATLVRNYDNTAYQQLKKRKAQVELIHYTRRYDRYLVMEGTDILEGRVNTDALKNKIVLIGYVNNNPNDIEDKHFTPMNVRFAGRASPDMNGIVIHANIISMILDSNYINTLPGWLNWVITVLLTWLSIAVLLRYYIENHLWFHLIAKIGQVLAAIIFAYIGIILFSKMGLRLDFKIFLIVLMLSTDIIYFYEAFAIWLHQRFGFKTVFFQNHH